MNTTITKTKLVTMAEYLECSINDLDWHDWGSQTEILLGHKGYIVLTDDEADEAVADYIKESIWAFRPSFLKDYCDLSQEILEHLQDKCESVNDLILSHINNMDELIEEAVSLDGRGHFLASYDGHENEHNNYFIYRTN